MPVSLQAWSLTPQLNQWSDREAETLVMTVCIWMLFLDTIKFNLQNLFLCTVHFEHLLFACVKIHTVP